MRACWPKNAYWMDADQKWKRDVHTEQTKVYNKSALVNLRILFEWKESAKPSCELSLEDKFKWQQIYSHVI